MIVTRTQSWKTPVSPPGLVSVVAAGLVVAIVWAGARGRGRLGFYLTIAAVAAMALVLLLSGVL